MSPISFGLRPGWDVRERTGLNRLGGAGSDFGSQYSSPALERLNHGYRTARGDFYSSPHSYSPQYLSQRIGGGDYI